MLLASDYTATNSSTVVLGVAANAGDEVEILTYQINTIGDTISASSGGTISSPITVNRNTTDGDILSFNKDGTAVGSIGTQGSRLSIGSGDVNLNFNASANSMYPISNPTSGALSDGIIDVGAATARFRNLYLSGGVFLGGTTTANKLSDYEEGTWTPTLSSTNGFSGDPTPSSTSGKYTKIGDLVRCTGVFIFSAAATHTDYSYCGGLPFLSSHNSGTETQAAGIYNSGGANDQNPTGTIRIGISNDIFSLVRLESAPNTSNIRWIFAFTYHTNQ
jgi:hypothetical protein